MMTINNDHRTNGALRPELASQAEFCWASLKRSLELSGIAPSSLGLLESYLVSNFRAFRHERELEVLKRRVDELEADRPHLIDRMQRYVTSERQIACDEFATEAE